MTDDQPDKPAGVPAPAPRGVNDPDVIEHVAIDRPEDRFEQRSFASKMFDIGFSGWFQLVVLCIVVGAIFQAGGIDFFAPNFTFTGFLGAVGRGAVNVLGWVLEAGWRPFLAGVIVVAPIWLAWRLLSFPFRH